MAKRKTKTKAIAIIYSDLHLQQYTQFNQGNRRVNDALDVMKTIKLKAKALKIPTLFVGDLFSKEKHISNKLLDIVTPTFKMVWGSKRTITYGIDGNHDQSEENTLKYTSPSYINTFSRLFKGLVCLNHKTAIVNNMAIHGIPYLTHDLGLQTSIENAIENIVKGKINILLLHTTLPGSMDTDDRKMDSNIKPNIVKLLKAFDIVFVGHIHKPMQLADNTYQVGAPNHQRKTDRNSNMGYCLLYSDLSVEYIHLDKYPKFIELKPGEKHPDNKNFYYNKEHVIKAKESNNDFSNTDDHTGLAKMYLKEKGIKDKHKRRALIKVLKQ
jgi:DNA repair exonuclease SbcCD nuclease subunit